MLYKILLTMNYPMSSEKQMKGAIEKLAHNNWKCFADSDMIWITEIIGLDVLSVKFKIERELHDFFKTSQLPELNYAFQVSLGEVSKGTLKYSPQLC